MAETDLTILTRDYASPVGNLTLGSFQGKLCMCLISNCRTAAKTLSRIRHYSGTEVISGTDAVLEEAARQLDAYFAGRLRVFDLPLLFFGTSFQQSVWEGLTRIPCGHTLSYGEMARRIGFPRATRAVGTAVGANPLAIIVPCHRVIASSGALGGYAGGLEMKQALLSLERSTQNIFTNSNKY